MQPGLGTKEQCTSKFPSQFTSSQHDISSPEGSLILPQVCQQALEVVRRKKVPSAPEGSPHVSVAVSLSSRASEPLKVLLGLARGELILASFLWPGHPPPVLRTVLVSLRALLSSESVLWVALCH